MKFSKSAFIVGIALCIAALSSCKEDFSDSPYPPLTLHALASFPGGGRSSAVAFAIEEKGYVALGRNKGSNGYQNDCWQYDPTTNSWSAMSGFPGSPRVKAIAAAIDSIAYVGLGYGGNAVYTNSGYFQDFWAYNAHTNSWTRKSDFPSKKVDACVSFVYNKQIYVGEGYDGYGFYDELWRYTPSTDTWTRLKDSPARVRGGAVMVFNGKRAFFGTGFRGQNMKDWWEYFPETDNWKQLNDVPGETRVNGVAFAVGARIFLSTGRHWAGSETGGHVKNDILEYNPDKDQWYKRGEIPASGRENAISFVINGRAYLGLGESTTTLLSDMWTFEP